MTCIFIDFRDENYLKKKIKVYLRAIGSEYKDVDWIIDYIASSIYKRPMDFLIANEKEDMNKVPCSKLCEIQNFISMAREFINKFYPLIKCECIIKDRVTYLLEDYSEYKKGTPIFIRESTESTMVHFFPCYRYSNGKIEFIKEDDKDETIKKDEKEIPQAVKDLFKNLAGSLAGMIGSYLFDKVFPKEVKDLDDLLVKIKESTRVIFKEELDNKTVDDLNYKIKSVIQYMQEAYIPQKESGKSKEYLENILRVKDNFMWEEIMALLTGERYRGKGITHLVTGASTHLAILQELAIVDPKYENPNDSPYMKTYYLRLNYYIDILDKAIGEIYSKRITYLSDVKTRVVFPTGLWWYFRDDWVCYTYETTPWATQKPDEACKKEREWYDNNVFRPRIVNDLAIYNKTKNDWIAIKKK